MLNAESSVKGACACDIAAEDERLNVVSALISVDGFEVQHVTNHWVLVHDAVGAEHVARHPCDLQRRIDVVAFSERYLFRTHRAGILQLSQPQTYQLRL